MHSGIFQMHVTSGNLQEGLKGITYHVPNLLLYFANFNHLKANNKRDIFLITFLPLRFSNYLITGGKNWKLNFNREQIEGLLI